MVRRKREDSYSQGVGRRRQALLMNKANAQTNEVDMLRPSGPLFPLKRDSGEKALRRKIALWIFGLLMVAAVSPWPVWAGTLTPHEFIYKPSLGARGAEEKLAFDAGLDRLDARLGKEIWVGDPNYGVTLQHALSAIGSNNAILRIPSGTQTIAANLTIPANITLKMERGVMLAIADGVTLSLNGGLDAGLYQIFSCFGTGRVMFAPGTVVQVYPQWWGAKGDGIANDTAAITAALAANSCVYVPAGTYLVNPDTIDFKNFNNGKFSGAGMGRTNFQAATPGTYVIGSTGFFHHSEIGSFTVNSDDKTAYATLFQASGSNYIHDIDNIRSLTNKIGGMAKARANAAGSGYVVGDVLTVGSGSGTVNVASVNGSGGVTGVSVAAAGTGYRPANSYSTTGGNGSGCTILVNIVVGSGRGFGLTICAPPKTGSYYSRYENIRAGNFTANFEYGFWIEGDVSGNTQMVNDNVFLGCITNYCSGAGVFLDHGTGNTFLHHSFEINVVGLAASNLYAVSLVGGYFESNGTPITKSAVDVINVLGPRIAAGQAIGFTPNGFDTVLVGGMTPTWLPEINLGGPLKAEKAGTGSNILTSKVSGDIKNRLEVRTNDIQFGDGANDPDAKLLRRSAGTLGAASGDHFQVDGTWNGGRLLLGNYNFWVDSSGKMRIKHGPPTSDSDGQVVGSQQ